MAKITPGSIPTNISGQIVQISGQCVTVLSGIGVITQSGLGTIIQSGAGVLTTQLSGTGVIIQSGAGVIVQSGAGVIVQSGAGVLTTQLSGTGVIIQSGAGVIVQSGAGVIVQSGNAVDISGQSVTVISGTGVIIQSGAGVIAAVNSGTGVIIQSGVGVIATIGSIALASVTNIPVTASTDIFALTGHLTPTNTPCTFRVMIAMSTAGTFSAVIYNGVNPPQVLNFNVVPGPALVANGLYAFDMLVHANDIVDFQYTVTGGILVLRVQELDSASA